MFLIAENAYTSSGGMMTLLLVLSAVTIMIMLLRRHQFRTTSSRSVAREQLNRLRDQKQLRASLDDLLIQLEEVAREVGGQIDTKFAKLEAVVRDADERIAELRRLAEQVEAGRQRELNATPPDLASMMSRPEETARDAAPSGVESSEDPPRKRARVEAPPPPATARRSPTSNLPPPPLFQKIYERADSGMPTIKIAESLHMTLGEVELILNLRRDR